MAFLLGLLCILVLASPAGCSATYSGVVLDAGTGKPVEGMRVLCRGYLVDHGTGNWLRYKILGGDSADVDAAILAATVTGPDGRFVLKTGTGHPNSVIQINKNGEYGVYDHNVPLSESMVIPIKDQPLVTCRGRTTTHGEATPDAAAERVLFATRARGNGCIYCLDGKTGDCLWYDRIFWNATSPVVTADGRAFVATEAGAVLAYDIESGRRLWERHVQQELGRARIVCHEGFLYVAAGPGYEEILAISQVTGEVTQRIDTDVQVEALLLSADHLVARSQGRLLSFSLPLESAGSTIAQAKIVVPSRNGEVLTVERRGGWTGPWLLKARVPGDLSVRWESLLPDARAWQRGVLLGGRVLCLAGMANVGAPANATACGVDAASGDVLWARDLPRSIVDWVAVPQGGDRVLIHTAGYGITCLSAASGEVLWGEGEGHTSVGRMLVAETHAPVVVGEQDTFRRVDPAGGREIWRFSCRCGSMPEKPATTPSSVFVISWTDYGNGVTRLSAETGRPIWQFEVRGIVRAPVTCVPEQATR
jgi:outer membrane protein assembly factor BamB